MSLRRGENLESAQCGVNVADKERPFSSSVDLLSDPFFSCFLLGRFYSICVTSDIVLQCSLLLERDRKIRVRESELGRNGGRERARSDVGLKDRQAWLWGPQWL